MKQTLHVAALFTAACLFIGGFFGVARAQQPASAQNVVIFLMDGYRWQELYRGADSSLIFDNKYSHTDSAYTLKRYWAADMAARRQLLIPFVWTTVVKQGQLYGNRDLGSMVNVRNKFQFSYPGRS